MSDLKSLQKKVLANKVAHGFNTTNVELEFLLTYEELAEAFEAWRKKKPDVGEELADVIIYLMGIAEILGFDLDKEVTSKIKKNTSRPLSVGNQAPQMPEQTYSLGGQLDIPMGSNWHMMTRVDWSYIGDMWFHTLQGEEVPTIWQVFFGPGLTSNMSKAKRDSYDTVDARMSFSNDDWTFTLWGRNLTKERYLQEVIPAPEFGGSFIHPSPLRSYGVEVTYSF